jgi:hypothetical protein
MGQRANSGRHAELDDKKLRAAGRQNEPREKIAGRDHGPARPVGGAGENANKKKAK